MNEAIALETFGARSDIIAALDGNFVVPAKDDCVCETLRLYGQHEKPSIDLVKAVLTEIDPKKRHVILDIGCNVGTWTVPLARFAGVHGKVFSFDAQKELILHLSATLLLNDLHNVYPYNAIVTNNSGHTTLKTLNYSSTDNFGGYSINRLSAVSNEISDNFPTSYVVQNIVLDDFYTAGIFNGCPSFMKLDIELHELYALIGGFDMLLDCHPILYIETLCKPLMRSLLALLNYLGYSMAWVILPSIDVNAQFDNGIFGFNYASVNPNSLYSGLNILAYPKTLNIPIINYYIQKSNLIPIDYLGGKYHIDDYNITVCFQAYDAEGRAYTPCTWLHFVDQGNYCGIEKVSDFAINYWKRFEL